MDTRKPRPPKTESLIGQVRLAEGLTQAEFAARIGVDKRTLGRYEQNNSMPRSEAVLRILRQIARKHSIAF